MVDREARSRPRPRAGPLLTRPRLGFSPKRPQQLAGMRIEPPPSLPWATGTMPEATAAAEPPEDPPLECSVSQGLRVGPKASGSVVIDGPELGGVGTAEDDKAGPLEPLHEEAVPAGPVAGRLREGGPLAVGLARLGGAEVLQQDRHPSERPVGQLARRLARGPRETAVDDGVQGRVALFDASRSRPRRARGREISPGATRCGLRGRVLPGQRRRPRLFLPVEPPRRGAGTTVALALLPAARRPGPHERGNRGHTAEGAVGVGGIHQPVRVLGGELEVGRLGVALQLGDGAGARDRDDVRMADHPGKGDLGRGRVVAGGDVSQRLRARTGRGRGSPGRKAGEFARMAVGRCSAS